jgi:single-strand DNA-binding protein
LVGLAERFLKKGSKVYIEGQLETRKWTDQAGQEKYTTEVVLRPYRGEITMLDGKRDGSSTSMAATNDDAPSFGPSTGSNAAPELDDQIPF